MGDSRIQCCFTQADQLVVHVTLQLRQIERDGGVEVGYDPNEPRIRAEQVGRF